MIVPIGKCTKTVSSVLELTRRLNCLLLDVGLDVPKQKYNVLKQYCSISRTHEIVIKSQYLRHFKAEEVSHPVRHFVCQIGNFMF